MSSSTMSTSNLNTSGASSHQRHHRGAGNLVKTFWSCTYPWRGKPSWTKKDTPTPCSQECPSFQAGPDSPLRQKPSHVPRTIMACCVTLHRMLNTVKLSQLHDIYTATRRHLPDIPTRNPEKLERKVVMYMVSMICCVCPGC